MTLANVTLAGNRVVGNNSQGAGVFFNDDVRVQRTIVADNANGAATDECFVNSVVITSTANLATDAADCAFTAPGDLSADPLLAPLADTGGPTDTRAPGPGSPALDRAAFASCPALDQRGFPRQGVATGAACDLGAHEAGAVAGALPPPAPPPPPPPAPAPPPAPPKLTVASVLTLPPARRCVSRRAFRIRLRAPKGVTLQQATVLVNGRRARVVRGRRLTAPVDLRGLPKGRFTVKVTVTTTDGRRVSDTRRYRTCAPRRRGR
jgi:hypothetical protein